MANLGNVQKAVREAKRESGDKRPTGTSYNSLIRNLREAMDDKPQATLFGSGMNLVGLLRDQKEPLAAQVLDDTTKVPTDQELEDYLRRQAVLPHNSLSQRVSAFRAVTAQSRYRDEMSAIEQAKLVRSASMEELEAAGRIARERLQRDWGQDIIP